MHLELVCFEIGCIVFEMEGDDRKRRTKLTLTVDRTRDDESFCLIQRQGMITNVGKANRAKFAPGTEDHELIKKLISFLEKWCNEKDPFYNE